MEGEPRRSASHRSLMTDNDLEDDEEYNSSDEEYLEPGEPYGAFLAPAEQPYDRRERVEQLNQRLKDSQQPEPRPHTRVDIREDLNQYFSESESQSQDEGSRSPTSRRVRTRRSNNDQLAGQQTSAGRVAGISLKQSSSPAVQRPPTPRQSDGDKRPPDRR